MGPEFGPCQNHQGDLGKSPALPWVHTSKERNRAEMLALSFQSLLGDSKRKVGSKARAMVHANALPC